MAKAKISPCRVNLLEACPELQITEGSTQKDKLIELKAFLIGKGGEIVKQMEELTHTKISYKREDILITGTEGQIRKAETLIRQKIREYAEKLKVVDIQVPIEKSLKGFVMGKERRNLEKNRGNGMYTYRSHGKIIVRGDKTVAEEGARCLQNEAAKARRKQTNQGSKERNYCFVDDVGLQEEVDLKLVEPQENAHLNDKFKSEKQFVLKVCSDSMEQLPDPDAAVTELKYSEIVAKAVREVLEEIKSNAHTPDQWVDLWAHFGQVLIHGVDEVDEEESLILSEAQQRVCTEMQSSENWKTSFREGIHKMKDSYVERRLCKRDVPCVFNTRYDQSILTPIHRTLRFKVWIARSDFNGNINEAPLPHDDFQSVIGEVLFTDDRTRARCRGWLCTETPKPLRVNVITPLLPFSYRFSISKGLPYKARSKKEEQENKKVLECLGGSFKLDEGAAVFAMLDVPLPEGFHIDYKRLSRRTIYHHDNLIITASNEESKNNNKETGARVIYDFYVRNSSWDKALKTSTWKSEDIAEGVPKFLTKLRTFANFLSSYEQ